MSDNNNNGPLLALGIMAAGFFLLARPLNAAFGSGSSYKKRRALAKARRAKARKAKKRKSS